MTTGPERTARSCALPSWIAFAILGLWISSLSCSAPPVREPSGGEALEVAGVPNVRRLSPHVFSGGRPEGVQGFEELARLGIRTVICVDGPPPDVEAAHAAGLRYVHLPVSYAGIERARAVEIVKAARDLPGPVFVHCHRGTQRGPTAAALAAIAVDGLPKEEALARMRAAGTLPHYEGLFGCVAGFSPPSTHELDALPSRFPETQPPPPLVEVMGALDSGLERIGTGKVREDPAHEALLLRENLVELARTRLERPAEFRVALDRAVAAAQDVEGTIRAGRPAARALAELERSCTACHERFRDTR